MSQILIVLSIWFHSLATIVFIGHHLLLSLIYLPGLAKKQEIPSGIVLSEISKRSRVWMYASLFIFIVTGIVLLIADPNYLGIGDFNNLWSVLMLIKHILILGMIVIGFWFNAILRVGPLMSSNSGADQALVRFRQYSNLMTITGILVLLLTAISQAQ
jgi:uncharacterized membrane protein